MMEHNLVLVVDEDETTSALLESVLSGTFQIVRFSLGLRAIQLSKSEHLQFIVLSDCLPDADITDLLNAFKNKFPQAPVLVVSECADKTTILKAFRNGAADFLEKPLTKEILSNACRHLLSMQRAIDNDSMPGTPDSTGQNASAMHKPMQHPHKWIEWSKRVFRGMLAQHHIHVEHNYVAHDPVVSDIDKSLLQVFFLGRFNVVLNDVAIEHWPSRKAKNLFAYLLYYHKRPQYKDVLMDKFWPSSTPDSARNCLNATVYSIRHLLHNIEPNVEYVLFKDDCYLVNPETEIWYDVEEFSHYWRMAQQRAHSDGFAAALSELELAAALYKGEFMEEEVYENWTDLDRENLKEIYLVILDRLSDYYSLDGKPATAIDLCKTILSKDSCRETVHQRLMRCYYRLGQRNKALKQFLICQTVLQDELEVPPTHATVDLYQQIRRDLLN